MSGGADRVPPWGIATIAPEVLDRLARAALDEDVGSRDATTEATVDAAAMAVGTLVARVVLKDQRGQPWKGEASMMVASKSGEPVARVPVLTADAMDGVLEPDETAQVVALFPESWGPGGKNKGPVWVTLKTTMNAGGRSYGITSRLHPDVMQAQ